MAGRPAHEIPLPKTVLSSVDGLVGAGGVIQTSPDNVTLYNWGVRLRLFGGVLPHDEILSPDGKVLSSYSAWIVQAWTGNFWTPMFPTSNNLALLGTNTSGTYVVRTEQVENTLYKGSVKVIYKATSAGPLKWDVELSPVTSGRYRLALALSNITSSYELSALSKTLRAGFGLANYTITWSDISSRFNSTVTFTSGQFLLTSDLGYLAGGSQVSLDPGLVGNVAVSNPTASTFQRKVFYEPKGARYFVIYYDGYQGRVSNSTDGIHWSPPNSLPTGLIPWSHFQVTLWGEIHDTASPEAAQPAVFYSGQTVIVAAGQERKNDTPDAQSPWAMSTSLNYVNGTISGPSISWSPVAPLVTFSDLCDNDSYCNMLMGIRNVNVGASSDGYPIFTYNLYLEQDSKACSPKYSESWVYAAFKGKVYRIDGRSGCGSFDQSDHDRPIALPADSQGNARIVYQIQTDSGVELRSSTIYPLNPSTEVQTFSADKDTYISWQWPGQNYGNANPLAFDAQGTPCKCITFIRFGFPLEIPGTQVVSASLKINEIQSSCGSSNCNTIISPHIGNWAESALTWSNANPPITIYPPSLNIDLNSNGIRTIDVTDIAKAWFTGVNGDFGFVFQMKGASNSQDFASISSREDSTLSNRPELTVSYCCTGTVETIDPNVVGTDEFSAVADADYNTHVVYTSNNGYYTMTNYGYLQNGSWTLWTDAFSGASSYPTITADYATNDVYILAIQGSSVAMRIRTPSQSWFSDSSISFPITGRIFTPSELTSNYFAVSSSTSNQIELSWTEPGGPLGTPYSVIFASIPIGPAWSPLSQPSDPWDGNGIVPYGQYFGNLDEQVSASTGILTLSQTDLTVPGRGLDLKITRVYTEPVDFINGFASGVEPYTWAPMGYSQTGPTGKTLGNSWQLNFPWMSSIQTPVYIHLWNGQGYRIPSSFWQGLSSSFENHRGENFRLVRNTDFSIVLYTASGTYYNFDSGHRLVRINDQTGLNNITLSYNNGEIYSIKDTAGRNFYLCYNADLLLNTILQAGSNSSCTSTNPIRTVQYTYGSYGSPLTQNLASVTDPLNRRTNYAYSSGVLNGPGSSLLTRVSYPTGWSSNYTYTPVPQGTEAVTYRVARVFVASNTGSRIKEFDYSFTPSPGNQVSNTRVTTFNGTSTQPVSFNTYDFSIDGVTSWILDGNNKQIRGSTQFFDSHGQVTQEIIYVSNQIDYDISGYANYYQYDLWGNLMYTRRLVENHYPISRVHDSYNAYYNNGLPPRFVAFQDTFSDNKGTASDESWNVYDGTWLVKNGAYNGTAKLYQAPGWSYFAYANIGRQDISDGYGIGVSDISVQTSAYVTNSVSSSDQRFGIFTHYPGTGYGQTGYYKWALVLHNRPDGSGSFLELLDDAQAYLADTYYGNPGQPTAKTSCQISLKAWYTFNMTVHGYQATGTATTPGKPPCSVSGTFSSLSPAAGGTAFGLYSGGYSTLFDNVTATTVTPYITATGFSNSFIPNGAPNPNIHTALAGRAELQNGTGTIPIEAYYSYTPWGGLSQVKRNPPMQASTMTYDSYGNLHTYTDPKGTVTNYDYASSYNYTFLTSQTRSLGATQISKTYTYNFTIGTVLSETDPLGNTTSYQYDLLGRVKRVIYPKNLAYLNYTYNDAGNFVDTVNENGWKTRQVYDGLGRLAIMERFSNGTPYSNQSYTWNWMNKATTFKDPGGRTTSYQYDVIGRTISVTKPDGNMTQEVYVDEGGWVWTIDENGAYTYREYDRLGRLLVVNEPQFSCYASNTCGLTNYYYDEVGNLAKVVKPNGQSTSYLYDGLSRPVNTTYADGTHEIYSYDNNGNLASKVDRNNVPAVSAYDELNRLTTTTFCGATLITNAYSYDRNSNLVSLKSQNATVSYTYDARGRPLSETYAVNSGGQPTPLSCPPGSGGNVPGSGGVSQTYTVGYAYAGEALSRITFPLNSLTLNYTYDGLGRVASVLKPGATPYATFNYNIDDEVKQITYGNGLSANYTYDRLGRPQTIAAIIKKTTLLSLAYGYTRTGLVSNVNGLVNTFPVNEQYSYDLYQGNWLTNATVANGSTRNTLWYEYDLLGNRLVQRMNGTSTSNKWQVTSSGYNLNNDELLSSTGPSGSTSYGYDRNGNLISTNAGSTHWTYTWDAAGNMLKASNGAGVQGSYAYDGMGRRVESKEGSTTTFHSYLGTETLYELVNGASTDYVYADGLRIAKLVSGSTLSYYQTDALGSTRIVTDPNGHVTFSDSYQPFGQDNGAPQCSSSCDTYKFTGNPVSATTGLYYEYQRWYDPSIGRFISQDPLGGRLSDPQSLNPYVYVENTPTVFTDPTGMGYTNGSEGCGWTSNWGGCLLAGIMAVGAWYSSLSPEEKRVVGLGALAAITVVTGGTDLLIVGALGFDAFAGAYAGYTYATGGTPTGSGVLEWGSLGFGLALTAYGGYQVAERLLSGAAEPDSLFSDFNFRDQVAQDYHFNKHLTEFSPQFTTGDEYLANARSFMDNSASNGNLFIQGSGTKVYAVEPGTGNYVAYDPTTRTILTYHVNRSGWRWVLNQIKWQGWWPYPIAP